MCGILAIVTKDGRVDPSACRRALSAMYWRGPDFAFSSVWEDRLFLGQTVLSITGDPRAGLSEYQRSRSGRYEVLYNGEIYNFRRLEARYLSSPGLAARYGTDTEVLVNLHEILAPGDVPPALDGMYAYAVFDREARQLHVARDVQGEKSLYVYEDAERVVVASEIRALHALVPGIALDPQALRDYFRTRHLMLFDRTVHGAVRELRPGHLETLDLDTFKWSETRVSRLSEWIDPPRLADNARRSVESLADELDGLLANCVREMIPARRYAAVVSGGVDSSLLARHLVSHGDPDLLVAVNHVGKDRISADLAAFERVLGRPIRTLSVDAAGYAAEIGRCQQTCGSPLHAHSFVPQSQQCALVRSAGCKVLFGGEGADELFGGYDAYLDAHEPAGRYSPSPYTAHLTPRVSFGEDAPETLQAALAAAWREALDAYAFVEDGEDRAALAMMYCDAVVQLPAVGLRGADLMSMMWSVETRSVYLRRPLVAFALNLPRALKVDRGEGVAPLLRAKPLLKRLFVRHYGAALLAEKQGFAGFPNEAADWLGAPDDYLVGRSLGIAPGSLATGWADRATAWKLINLEYFLRQRAA
jgi:asparagine synthase (glutamine-hydrolysing)